MKCATLEKRRKVFPKKMYAYIYMYGGQIVSGLCIPWQR